jgi:hypothetical protein
VKVEGLYRVIGEAISDEQCGAQYDLINEQQMRPQFYLISLRPA